MPPEESKVCVKTKMDSLVDKREIEKSLYKEDVI